MDVVVLVPVIAPECACLPLADALVLSEKSVTTGNVVDCGVLLRWPVAMQHANRINEVMSGMCALKHKKVINGYLRAAGNILL